MNVVAITLLCRCGSLPSVYRYEIIKLTRIKFAIVKREKQFPIWGIFAGINRDEMAIGRSDQSVAERSPYRGSP